MLPSTKTPVFYLEDSLKQEGRGGREEIEGICTRSQTGTLRGKGQNKTPRKRNQVLFYPLKYEHRGRRRRGVPLEHGKKKNTKRKGQGVGAPPVL